MTSKTTRRIIGKLTTSKAPTLGVLAAAALGLALAAPAAQAQVRFGVAIGAPPPPLRYETRPPIPGPGYVWTDGYYEPYGGRYRWHAGYWQQPPFAGGYYVHPHWDHYPDGWRQHEGYWAHEDHDPHYWDHYGHQSDPSQPGPGQRSRQTRPGSSAFASVPRGNRSC